MSGAQHDLHGLIDAAYAAALDPELWSDFLARLAARFRGIQASFFSHDSRDARASIHAGAGIDPAFVASYTGHFCARNPFVGPAARVPLGRLAVADDLVDRALYLGSEFYNDWVRPQGGLEFATTTLARGAGSSTGVTVVRGPRPFSAGERACWARLMPHLGRAVQVHRRLRRAELAGACSAEGLERLALGVLVTDADGVIAYANRVADGLLDAGLGLRMRDGRLCGGTPAATERIRAAIRQAADASAGRTLDAGGAQALDDRPGAVQPVLVSPLSTSGALAGFGPGALVLVADPLGRPSVSAGDLGALFTLTSAEARLLAALLEGVSLTDYAARAGISVETARAHLRRVFDKTGQHRQVDLMRAILVNPVIGAVRI